MTPAFPKWFFTRPSGFALLLGTLVMVDLCVALLRQQRSDNIAALLAGVAFMLGAAALLLTAILWVQEFDEPHDYDDWQAVRWTVYVLQVAMVWIFRDSLHGTNWTLSVVVAVAFLLVTRQAGRRSVPVAGERRRGEPQRDAYLVITIDLRKDPPVVVRAAIFSCKGSQLTSIGRDELNLDVLDGRGDSYEQARADILRGVPIYCPALAPFLRKSGEDL